MFAAWLGALAAGALLTALGLTGFLLVAAAREPALLRSPGALRFLLQDLLATPGFLVASATASALVLAGTALAGARLSGEGVKARLRLGPSGLSPARLAAAALGLLALGEACSALLAWADLPLGPALAWFEEATSSAAGATVVGEALSVGLLAGVSEELFFRGFMQARLSRRFGPWPATLLAAAAFGLAHLDPVHSTFAFAIGLYAGWLLERTGSVRAGIAGHVLNNTASVLLAAASTAGLEQRLGPGRVLLASLAVLAGCVAVVRGGSPGRARGSGTPHRHLSGGRG